MEFNKQAIYLEAFTVCVRKNKSPVKKIVSLYTSSLRCSSSYILFLHLTQVEDYMSILFLS